MTSLFVVTLEMFVFFRRVPTSLNVLVTATNYDELLLVTVTSDFIYQLQACKRLQHICCFLETSLTLDNLMVLFSLIHLGWQVFPNASGPQKSINRV